MNECYLCTHSRNVPGTTHIACEKPDPQMTGDQHGIRNGWFVYPLLFDPVWKTRVCSNFQTEVAA